MKKYTKGFILVAIIIYISGMLSYDNKSVYAEENTNLVIGDYIYFGEYNGKPILWQIIHFDAEGNPLILSDNIISYKPFDSAESGEWGSVDEDSDTIEARQQFGSNRWENSNIREWLNSNEMTVTYSTSLPSEDGVWNNSNDYAEEQGFLSNFTAKEQLALLPVLNETIVSMSDEKFSDAGSAAHEFVFGNPLEALSNYNESFKERTIDKVFLLSLEQVYNYVVLGGTNLQKDATESAYNLDESDRAKAPGNNDNYWLRDATGNSSTSVRNVTSAGQINYDSAYYNNLGIVPALYLNSDLLSIQEGVGSSESPYSVNINDSEVVFEDKNLESAIREMIGKPSGILYASDVNEITSLYASGRQISSIEGLDKLTNLKFIDISFNEISDFSPLNDFYGLETLYAQYNRLEDLTPIISSITNNYNPSSMTLDITGNLLDINNDATKSNFAYMEGKGATLIYETDIYKSLEIEGVIATYLVNSEENEEDSKEQLVAGIEGVIYEVGQVEAKATDNHISITNDMLQGIAQEVVTKEKEASRQLSEKEISINREIINSVTINIADVNFEESIYIDISEEIASNVALDKIYVASEEFIIGFEPSKLSKDLLRDETLVVEITKSEEIKETTNVLGQYKDEQINLPLGNFATTIEEKARNLIGEKVENDDVIINASQMVTGEENTSVYTMNIYKNDKLAGRIMSKISFGIIVPKEDVYGCVVMENTEDFEYIGGIYDDVNKTIYIETSRSGAYYLTSNKTTYDDIYTLDEEGIQAIQVLASKNILLGREENLYKPEDYISREEIAAAIVKLCFMYDETANSNFTDVDKSSPYYKYISSSEANGIINGYPDNTFRPDISIVNSELTKLTSAILVYYGEYIYPTDTTKYLGFSNIEEIPEWVHDYLALTTRESLIDGEMTEYNVNMEMTRVEAAKMLYRIFEKM